MPLYDYECKGCGHIQEEIHPATKKLKIRCPRCGKKLKKRFPAPNVRTDTEFLAGKGDGFGENELGRRQEYARLRREGKSVPGSAFYSHQLGGWVEGRSDLRRQCIERGLGCEEVNVKPRFNDAAAEQPYEVADSILNRAVEREITQKHGGHVTAQQKADIREKLQKSLSGNSKEKHP